MKTLCICLIFASVPLIAQQEISNPATESVNIVSGGNTIAICTALSSSSDKRYTNVVSISAASNASPVEFTSTGHGFDTNGMLPSVTVSGGTGNWAAVNGTFIATITGANTFTIPVNSTTFGAVTGTLVFRTTAPRSTVAEWQVQLLKYDGSNNLVWSGWLNGSNAMNQKCSDYASATTVVQ